MGEHSPSPAATQYVENGVEDFAHGMLARSPTRLGRGYQRLNSLPFGIAQITGVCFSFHKPVVYSINIVFSTFQTRS